MEDFLPDAVEAGRHKARRQAIQNSSKICLHIEDIIIPVADFYESGFTVNKRYTLPNRANVEIFDGATSLYLGMIHYSDEEDEFQKFEFKRLTPIRAEQPKDYADDAPDIAGLITKR